MRTRPSRVRCVSTHPHGKQEKALMYKDRIDEICDEIGLAAPPARKEKLLELVVAMYEYKESGSPWLNMVKREHERMKAAVGEGEWGEMDDLMRSNVEALCAVFGMQGHSGFSAGVLRRRLSRLIDWLPLVPLEDAPDQWKESDLAKGSFQHRCCPSVWKEEDGSKWQQEYYVFREPSGSTYTSENSRRRIDEFPYMPPDRPVVLDIPDRKMGDGEKKRVELRLIEDHETSISNPFFGMDEESA